MHTPDTLATLTVLNGPTTPFAAYYEHDDDAAYAVADVRSAPARLQDTSTAAWHALAIAHELGRPAGMDPHELARDAAAGILVHTLETADLTGAGWNRTYAYAEALISYATAHPQSTPYVALGTDHTGRPVITRLPAPIVSLAAGLTLHTLHTLQNLGTDTHT